MVNENRPIIYPRRFLNININKKITIDLSNLDLINQLTVHNANFERINHAFSTINSFIEMNNDAFVNKKIEFENYKENINYTLSKTEELKNMLNKSIEKTIKLFATVRVLSDDMPFLAWIIKNATKSSLTSSHQEKILNEIDVLKSELNGKGKEKNK